MPFLGWIWGGHKQSAFGVVIPPQPLCLSAEEEYRTAGGISIIVLRHWGMKGRLHMVCSVSRH